MEAEAEYCQQACSSKVSDMRSSPGDWRTSSSGKETGSPVQGKASFPQNKLDVLTKGVRNGLTGSMQDSMILHLKTREEEKGYPHPSLLLHKIRAGGNLWRRTSRYRKAVHYSNSTLLTYYPSRFCLKCTTPILHSFQKTYQMAPFNCSCSQHCQA